MNSKYLQQGEPLYVEAARMMGGDFSSYQEFYNLSVQYLYGIVNGIISDEAIAGNLTNDLYNDIYSAIYQLKDPAVFLVWAGNMATNKAFSYVCANRTEVMQEAGNTDDSASAEGEQGAPDEYVTEFSYQDQEPFIPEDFMRQQSVMNIVNERIAALPVLTRCVMQKYYYHDLPVKQIAYELNIPPYRVAQELSKVKRMMKDVIAASYGENYMNRVRVNSLAEMSIVWIAFAGMTGQVYAGVAAGSIAVGGAAVAGSVVAGASVGGAATGSAAGAVVGGALAAGTLTGGAASAAGTLSAGIGSGVGGFAGSGMAAGAGVGGFAGAGGAAGTAVAGTAAVTGGNIAAGAVGGSAAAGTVAVTGGNIAAGAVGGSAVTGASAVTGGNIAAGAVGGSAATGASAAGTAAVTGGNIAAGAVSGGAATGASSAGTAAVVGSAVTKTGLGAKVAIGVAVTAAVAGGAAGVYTAVNGGFGKNTEKGIYAEVNGLEFSENLDGYTSPGYVALTDSNGDEIQIEDVEIIQHNSETSITDYSETITDDGYRILSFTTQTALLMEINDPNSKLSNVNISLSSFDLFDYYTGLTLPSKETYGNEQIGGELNVEYEDEGYDISYTEQVYWEWGDWDFSGDGNNSRNVTMYCYYEVTIPEDYDGLCLAYDKSGKDHKTTDEEFGEIDSEELLENCDVEDIICFRMENLREGQHRVQPMTE